MECQTLQYRSGRGWNVDAFPDLDSENTLVLVFAAPAYFQDPSPIKELADYYKQSKMIGCSSAGEIYGGGIADNSVSVAIVRFSHTTVRVASAQVMQISSVRHWLGMP